jgi:hypothetical protein
MAELEIAPQETVELIAETNSERWDLEIDGTDIRLGRTEQRARREGRILRQGDRGELQAPDENEAIYAHNPSSVRSATLTLDPVGFLWDRAPRYSLSGITDSIETNNYDDGGAFDHDGSAYPYTVDPGGPTIQELIITTNEDIIAEITTETGTVIPLPLAGSGGSFDFWNIDLVEFQDPNATGARVAGGWAGE